MGQYFDITLINSGKNKKSTIKMEAGVTYENKNFSYTMKQDGKLSIFDKNTKKTTTSSEIKFTDYQCRTIFAVANNNDETKDGSTVLSADDIQSAIDQYNDSPDILKNDLKENLKNGYKVRNPKAFESENKISAYIYNGKETQSSVVAFSFAKEYYDAKILNVTSHKTQTIKMEKGISFENNGAIYRMNNDGLLAKYDKNAGEWSKCDGIEMTQYQLDVFNAVADNVKEDNTSTVLSKGDLLGAIDLYRNKNLNNDLTTNLKNNYSIQNTKIYSNNTAFSTFVTNGKKNQSANLIFKFGSAKEALEISDFVNNNDIDNNYTPKESKNVKRTGKILNPSKLKPSNDAYNIIKGEEKLVLCTYDDLDKSWPRKFIKKGMKYRGTLTIGYGHTKGVKSGQKITESQANKYLEQDVSNAVKAVKKYVKVDLKQNEFDALVSFAYNSGEGNFKNSTLLKCVNNNDFKGAAQQFDKWIYSKGQICKGLVKRRGLERKLFEK